MTNVPPIRLSEEARSALIVEILGDVGRMHDTLVNLSDDLQEMRRSTQEQSAHLVKWTQILDQKILELEQINLSALASERLAGHARDYLRALSGEVSKLVEQEVQTRRTSPCAPVAPRIGIREFAGGVIAVVMGHFVWALLTFLSH